MKSAVYEELQFSIRTETERSSQLRILRRIHLIQVGATEIIKTKLWEEESKFKFRREEVPST